MTTAGTQPYRVRLERLDVPSDAFSGVLPLVKNHAHDKLTWDWEAKHEVLREHGADIQRKFGGGRPDERNRLGVGIMARVFTRTAITYANSPNAAPGEHVEAGRPTLNSAFVAAVNVEPITSSTMSGAFVETPPTAEDMTEGNTATGWTPNFGSSGQLPPIHDAAFVSGSRQWKRFTPEFRLIDQSLDLALLESMDAHIGALAAVSSFIPSSAMAGAPAAATRAKLLDLEKSACAAGVVNGVYILSPGAYTRLAGTVENSNYLAVAGKVLDRPTIVTAGIPENLGAADDETVILYGDPLAITLGLWGVYTLEDKYTMARKGLVEWARGAFYRAVITQPTRLARLTGVATS